MEATPRPPAPPGPSSHRSPPRAALLPALAAITLTAAAAAAQPHTPAPAALRTPWVVKGDVPVPSWVKSARVLRADEPVYASPSKSGKKRGAAAREARLPVFAARSGPGCDGRWINVGAFAWICDSALELSGNDPVRAGLHTFADPKNGLPFRYYFVGSDGSSAYRRLELADIGEPAMALDPGFAVALIEEKLYDGALYGRTSHNLWVPMRDLGPAHPSTFQGEVLPAGRDLPAEGPMPFAWVLVDKARVHRAPGGAATSESRARFEVVPITGEAQGGRHLQIGPSQWISAKDVRRPTVAPPPAEIDVASGERWIDVELATQTLVAYEGARPVFATLVSTGKGKQGSASATPIGVHHIWIKLLATDMDNLEDENASRYYRMESVPYPQFFSKGVGLHGAYWHRSFGNVRSHGCVNLSPLDAQRLFWWTGPRVPAGWTAAFPMPHEPGTVIRVR